MNLLMRKLSPKRIASNYDIAYALHYAHQGVSTGTSSGNIPIDKQGQTYLTDCWPRSYLRTFVDLSGTVIGTPDYMSPEQARRRDKVDARSDTFHWGQHYIIV